MSGFTVTTEQLLLNFDQSLAAVNVRAFEAQAERARIVCFHGYVGNARDFDPLAEFLAGNGVTVIAADMFGRGDSAHFAVPGDYTLRRMVQAGAAVLAGHGKGAAILGVGWGALIGLLAQSVTRTSPRSLIAVDLKLDYSVDTDPIIAAALADRGLSFPTAAAAIAHLRRSFEFGALPDGADIGNRIRPEGTGFRLSHDDDITEHTRVFGGRNYDLRAMLAALAAPVLMLDAGDAQRLPAAGATSIGGLSPAGPLLLRSEVEHYTILGYLLANRSG